MNSLTSKDNVLKNPGVLIPLLYIFVAVIPHAVAPRYILAGAMLLVLVYQLFRGQLQKPRWDAVSIAVFALCAVTLLSATVSPYRAESIPLLRKETIPFLVAYLLLTIQKTDTHQSRQIISYTMWFLILGFTVKMVLAISAGVMNGWQFSVYEGMTEVPRYLDYFAADIIYYIPFLLGVFLFWPIKSRTRVVLGTITLLTLAFAFVAGVRTTFVFVCFTLLTFTFVRFWAKKVTIFAIIGLVLLTGYVARDYITNPSIARYYSIFSMETYSKFGEDGSISERKAITKTVWEISKERFWLGYGPGWKKLPTVAAEHGHMDRWKASEESIDQVAYNYFSLGPGRVNPHNFYMMVLFETGIVGLATYIGLLCAIGWSAFRLRQEDKGTGLLTGVTLAALLYVLVYLGAGMASGPWLPVTLLAAAAMVSLASNIQKTRRISSRNLC